jgi:hypothetical protein
MTRTFDVLVALAIVCLAAPASAHGGHGHSTQPSTPHMQSSQTTNSTSHGLNPKAIAEAIAIDHKLQPLSNQLVSQRV